MEFTRAHKGTRLPGARLSPPWMVKHTNYLVRKEAPRAPASAVQYAMSAGRRAAARGQRVRKEVGVADTQKRAEAPAVTPSAVPSYTLGSSSAPASSASASRVTRHYVSLRRHNPHKVQMSHNGPIVPHKTIPSPRKSRARPASGSSRFLATAAAPANGEIKQETSSASERARQRHAATLRAQQEKQARLAAFDAKVKQRVTERVREQRAQALALRSQWSQLEAEARKSAVDWVESDFPTDSSQQQPQNAAGDNANGSEDTDGSNKICLQEHVLDVTARARAARAALIARARRRRDNSDAGSPSGVSISSSPPQTASMGSPSTLASPVAASEAPSMTPSERWAPDMSLRSGQVSESTIDGQSSAHLVAVARRAEMRAHREHTRRLREERRRTAAVSKRAAELERVRQMQDSLIEESRMANNVARDEYEEFLRQAERGLQEMEASKIAKVSRERHVSSRYMVALRQRLMDRMSEKKLQVPNICSCVRPEGTFFCRLMVSLLFLVFLFPKLTGQFFLLTLRSYSLGLFPSILVGALLDPNKPLWAYCSNNCEFYKQRELVERMTGDIVSNLRDSMASLQ